MRRMRDYLTEREIYILGNHPSKSYAKLGEELGVTGQRVRQIKVHAERVILLQKQKERAAIRALPREHVSMNAVPDVDASCDGQ